ncbi:MAG TPA: PadR family transcriptional regulator [Solirubrobacteraceae bacterium]|jgi:DNA-binding PadR family transcriptional regulator
MFGNRTYTTDPGDPGHCSGHHHPGHRHRHGPRGGGFGGGPFGFGPGGFGPGGIGPGGPRGRGRKARRGDIRTAALLLLAEEPRNGYQIMQEVEERSDGVWRPSPGSTYPALQQLEDEGLIRAQELDGRKLFQLTDAGRDYIKERGEDKPAPWEQMSGDVSDQAHELGRLIREVASAFTQIVKTGSEAQMGEARKVLTTTRKDLYRILADGDPEAASDTEA